MAMLFNNLGHLYQKGIGVPQSYKKAIEYYKLGAEKGESYSQYQLGYLYEMGYGIPKSTEKAIEWYQKAAAQGDEDAKASLAELQK